MAGRALDGADGEADDRLQGMHDLFALMETSVVELLRTSVAELRASERGGAVPLSDR